MLLLVNISLSAQSWEPIGIFDQNNNNIRVYELYPDTLYDRLYIGGVFYIINGDTVGNITSFDGTNFQLIADSMNACWNLGCDGVASIIRFKEGIVAGLMRSSTYEAMPQIIGVGEWRELKWHPLDGGLANSYSATNQTFTPAPIFDFAVADDILYAVGYINYVDSLPEKGMAAWDGTKWHTYEMPPVPPGDALLANSIAKYKGDIYLGGNMIVTINGEIANDLIRFDGAAWHRVGDGLVDGLTNLHDLEVFQNKLYVAGYFAKSDGNPGNSIMSWDGEQWSDLGGGVCTPFGTIDDLFVYKNKLYVAGYFDCIGGIEAHNVASWDGEKWCSIGKSTFNRAIHGVAIWRDTVYVGGSFFEVDGQPLRFLARFIGDHSTDTCSAPISAAPVPERSDFHISPNPASALLELQAPTPITAAWLFDATGREVMQVAGSGLRLRVSVEDLPPGLYFVSIRAGGVVWSGKFVKE